jgi:hypothetical protein
VDGGGDGNECGDMYKLDFVSEKEVDDVAFQDQYENETCEERSREGREKRRGWRCEWRQSNGAGSVRCTLGGDGYIPPSFIGINLFHSNFAIGDCCVHLT